ncbi:MAG TPA: hypothetical protein VJG30_02625 [Candidatus Nanoarchaeia archaeon]|nr:hypothetical protein [Candidatus Nanoarchaeia archaeon]
MKINRKEFLQLFNNHLNICVLPEQEKLKYVSWKEFITKHKISNSLVKRVKFLS